MIRRRSFLLTLAALAALGGLLLTMREPSGDDKSQQRLLPGFEQSLNDMTKIRIVSNGAEVDLTRGIDAQHWQVAQMGNYPADLSRLREFLYGLARSRVIEAKTLRPENYAKLGLDDRGLIHVVISKGMETAADLLIGRTSDKLRETFVRYLDNPQVWLTSGALRPFTTPLEWLRQEVLDIRPERVGKVTIHHGTGQEVTIARPNAKAEVSITPKPAEHNESLTYQVQTTLRALAHLKMTQVTPQSALSTSEPNTATFETFDGLKVTLQFAGNGKGEWLTIEASTGEKADQAVRAEAAAINERSKGWAYQFAPYIMSQLKLTADQLTKFNGPMQVK